MSNPYADIMGAIGDVQEYAGGRLLLPVSHYPMRLSVTKFDSSEVKPNGTGGNPYIQLVSTVLDGPFKDEDVDARVPLSFGDREKKAGYLGWINSATKAITGKDPLYDAMSEHGFPTTGATEWVDHYLSLDPEARKDFFGKYVRVAEWSGKTCVVAIGQEDRENQKTGKVGTFNRYTGFYKATDKIKGQVAKDYVMKVAFAKQKAEREAMYGTGA